MNVFSFGIITIGLTNFLQVAKTGMPLTLGQKATEIDPSILACSVKPGKNINFWIKGKTIISVEKSEVFLNLR